LEHCLDRSPNAEPPKGQLTLKENGAAWDLFGAQSLPWTFLKRKDVAETISIQSRTIFGKCLQIIEGDNQHTAHTALRSSHQYFKATCKRLPLLQK
jgi:hypothetical protein